MQLHDLPREFFQIKTFAVASRIRFSLIISKMLNWSTETVTRKAGMCSLKWQSQSIFLELMNFQMERQNTFGRINTVRLPNFLSCLKNQHQDSDLFESSLIILHAEFRKLKILAIVPFITALWLTATTSLLFLSM